MGNRVKGKTKKKSIKAALSSSAGSKRKLTRMGKKQKREHSGLEATFIGRSKCLKLLQITLKDFRRLCILKGIYPREPLGRVPGKKKSQTFYHIKDIRSIAHEPILEKFREFRAFMKKVRRSAGRNEIDEAQRKHALVPTYTLQHLVKERYPRFVDALGDLDDALTLTFLFAALPGEGDIKSKVTNKAKELASAWSAYCATTSSVVKSFISIKGVYLEAEIHGTPIRWIVPHAFTQYLPEDVDYRVMMTFFEFYEVLLKFVMFKLYNDIGVRFPFPSSGVGSSSALLASNLRLLTQAFSQSSTVRNIVTDSVDETVNKSSEGCSKTRASKDRIKTVGEALEKLKGDDSDEEDAADDVDVAGPVSAVLHEIAAEHTVPGGKVEYDGEALKRKHLFQGLTFFLSREVPRGYLEVIILSYGGKLGWEADDSPISMKDASITHHIVDRPRLPNAYDSLPKSREYVQPQWILDSTNFTFLLPIGKYKVGASLPPHLSPWVDDKEEGYTPAYAAEIAKLKNGESIDEAEHMEIEEEAGADETQSDKESIDEVESDKDEDSESEDEAEKSKRRERKRKQEEKEIHELAKSMMNRKAAHLYGRMQRGLAQKQAKVDELYRRRKEIDNTKEKGTDGRTVLKQKVERLKDERKQLEKSYSETGGSMKRAKTKSKR